MLRKCICSQSAFHCDDCHLLLLIMNLRYSLAADVKASSASKVIQADPAITVKQESNDAAGEVMRPVINAAGATKDVHEADLDLTHADSAPGTLPHLSI